jgi:hypothetical protein
VSSATASDHRRPRRAPMACAVWYSAAFGETRSQRRSDPSAPGRRDRPARWRMVHGAANQCVQLAQRRLKALIEARRAIPEVFVARELSSPVTKDIGKRPLAKVLAMLPAVARPPRFIHLSSTHVRLCVRVWTMRNFLARQRLQQAASSTTCDSQSRVSLDRYTVLPAGSNHRGEYVRPSGIASVTRPAPRRSTTVPSSTSAGTL